MNIIDRKFKPGEIVHMRGTKVVATIENCILDSKTKKWQYWLKGWGNPVPESAIQKFNPNNSTGDKS